MRRQFSPRIFCCHAGRGGSGKSLIAYRIVVEQYDRAVRTGQPPPRTVVVTGSARLRDAFKKQFEAYLTVAHPHVAAAALRAGLPDVARLPPGPAFFTTDELIASLNAMLAEPFRREAPAGRRRRTHTTLVTKAFLDDHEMFAPDERGRRPAVPRKNGPAELAEIISVIKGSAEAVARGRALTLAE